MNYPPVENPIQEVPAEVQEAARVVADYFAARGIETWQLGELCSLNHAEALDSRATIANRYRAMIEGVVEEVCVRRIEQIEGRVVSMAEVKQHGHMNICDVLGTTQYLWKGSPICMYQPAGYRMDGWHDAEILELSPRMIETPNPQAEWEAGFPKQSE